MKSSSRLRWSCSVRTLRTRPRPAALQCQCRRLQSTAQATQEEESTDDAKPDPKSFPSPPPYLAKSSASLNALHARLSLTARFPIETLARCLITASADPDSRFNNSSFSVLGNSLLSYFTAEAVICRYPRLPTQIVQEAMTAYHGHKTLAALCREWGIDAAASPGGEVDPGLLQFGRIEAGNAGVQGTGIQVKELLGKKIPPAVPRSTAKRREKGKTTVKENGQEAEDANRAATETALDSKYNFNRQAKIGANTTTEGVTLQSAASSFVQALFGAYYLHHGLAATKTFHTAHILSRHLDYSALFAIEQPTRDVSRLCARENLIQPVARILAETGRLSRHPVFVVGVFSGREKLGEGSGASLDEARIRASVNALKGWYLYSPLEVRVPSQAKADEPWRPCMIDGGEIIV